MGSETLHLGGVQAKKTIGESDTKSKQTKNGADRAVTDDKHSRSPFVGREGFLSIQHSDKTLQTPSVRWQILCQLDINYSHLRGKTCN